VILPAEEDYQLTIHSNHNGILTYYDVTITAQRLMGQPGSMNAAMLSRGDQLLDITAGEEMSSFIDSNGVSIQLMSQEFDYSPAMLMSGELQAAGSEYLTLGRAIRVVVITAGASILLLIICLVIFLVHWHRRRNGHPPYSDLYVIVPHLALTFILAATTSFCTVYLYTISELRAVFAAVTMAVVFLLALRALIRNHSKLNALFALITLLFVPAAYIYYSSELIKSHSLISLIVSAAVLIVLDVIAALSFRIGNKKQQRVACQHHVPHP